ncbi:MAG: recombination protein O N-terminal domain-containing protein [Victivallaceae bacterium]|nr:recombination protein O N-terminal domain-containing protein [Victivallaceae bacterium]
MVSTQIIVLDKRPYRESALLLAGISPDCGRIDLVAHGALKLADKSFPSADLFRELDVEFEEPANGGLATAKRLELATAFDTLADDPRGFRMAGKIGSFLLKNAVADMPLPYTYDALKSVLANLAATEHGAWNLIQCAVVIKATYLYENGLLPEAATEEQNSFIENLVAAGIENEPLPECDTGYWSSLNGWLSSLIDYHKLAR